MKFTVLHGTVFWLLFIYHITAQQLYKSEFNDASKRCKEDEITKMRNMFFQEIAILRKAMNSVTRQNTSLVCSRPWVSYKNSCYFFSNDYGNWKYGKTQCEQKRGSSKYLRINDEAEDTFIRNFVRSRGLTAYETRDNWIGGTDAEQDGVFKWEGHSQNFSYSNWGPNNPDRINSSDCVILFQRSDYKWHDTSCTNKNSYICEIEF